MSCRAGKTIADDGLERFVITGRAVSVTSDPGGQTVGLMPLASEVRYILGPLV
jgi:hypothetical protein